MTRTSRTMRLVFGDWSADGHGRTQEALVELQGSNVSDEALKAAFLKSQEEFGFNILDWCSDYEDGTVPSDEMEKLIAAGFDHEAFYGYSSPSAGYDDGSEYGTEIDFGAAILFYIGRNIHDFKWSYVTDNYTNLFGGDGVLDGMRKHSSQVGYGLFYL